MINDQVRQVIANVVGSNRIEAEHITVAEAVLNYCRNSDQMDEERRQAAFMEGYDEGYTDGYDAGYEDSDRGYKNPIRYTAQRKDWVDV